MMIDVVGTVGREACRAAHEVHHRITLDYRCNTSMAQQAWPFWRVYVGQEGSRDRRRCDPPTPH